MTNTDSVEATPYMIDHAAAAACAECEAASINWANNGGDWLYRSEVRTDRHRRRVAADPNH